MWCLLLGISSMVLGLLVRGEDFSQPYTFPLIWKGPARLPKIKATTFPNQNSNFSTKLLVLMSTCLQVIVYQSKHLYVAVSLEGLYHEPKKNFQ